MKSKSLVKAKSLQFSDDKQQQPKWNSITDIIPDLGVEIIGFNKSWIDEDVNPNGTCVCYLQDEVMPYFVVAKYCNHHDEWHTLYSHDAKYSLGDNFGGHDYIDRPTHWHPMIAAPII